MRLSRLCQQLPFRRARDIWLTIGRNPRGLTAAAIYIAATMFDEHRTQYEIGQVARVTEVTIRNRYKEIVKRLGPEFLASLAGF